MKRALIGLLTVSCVLSAPSLSKTDSLQGIHLEIGQSAEAAPKLPRFGRFMRWMSSPKVRNRAVSTAIDILKGTVSSNRATGSSPEYFGKFCKSESGRMYIVTKDSRWSYYNGSSWQPIFQPRYAATCYIDLATDSSGELYWRYSSEVSRYVP